MANVKERADRRRSLEDGGRKDTTRGGFACIKLLEKKAILVNPKDGLMAEDLVRMAGGRTAHAGALLAWN